MSYTPGAPVPPDGGGGSRTNPRGALVFAAVVVVVAIIAIGLFLTVGGNDPACDEWIDAKTEWVTSFPPIQQDTKADLADFQGWVEIDGERIDRPEECE